MRERKKLRKENYDYSKPGFYYITTCVHQKLRYKNIFGEIINKKMSLNGNGKILFYCWKDLPNHYHNIKLDKCVIMPDHFHGIIQIINVGNGLKPFPASQHNPYNRCHGLPEIMRGLKTFSSRRINEKNPELHFRWQKSYYDNIIYSTPLLQIIQNYIIQNPENWKT